MSYIPKSKVIRMDANDNCATALKDIKKGEKIEMGDLLLTAKQDIPFGHKIALDNIKKGDFVKKYGEIIGLAINDIKTGEWIHVHNLESHYMRVIKNG